MADAKQLRRRKQRQEKSEMRRDGNEKGFDKAHPVYDDSLLPKMTVNKNELLMIKEVTDMLEQGDDKLFTEENV